MTPLSIKNLIEVISAEIYEFLNIQDYQACKFDMLPKIHIKGILFAGLLNTPLIESVASSATNMYIKQPLIKRHPAFQQKKYHLQNLH